VFPPYIWSGQNLGNIGLLSAQSYNVTVVTCKESGDRRDRKKNPTPRQWITNTDSKWLIEQPAESKGEEFLPQIDDDKR
jgi:hypothetical protein